MSLLLTGPTFAQEQGGISGLVTDPANNRLQGAIIKIDALERETTTDPEGRFRLQGLPDGTHKVTVNCLGYETVDGNVTVNGDVVSQSFSFTYGSINIEEVEVIGSRFATASALNQERSSDTLKTVVAATDAGKFHDQNIAQALQRLVGVSIERSDGEGRFVSVRGLGPNFTNVKLNGARVPSTETSADRDRAVALDVVPSELLENLEVSKVVTAADDGDTISATVSIRSLSAYQRDGKYISYKAELGYDERSEQQAYKGSLVYSNLFADDKIGVALSVSTQDRDYLIENIEGDENDDAIANVGGIKTLQRLDLRTLDLKRERQGASLNFDFRPSDHSRYFTRFSYTHLLETELRARVSNEFRDNPVTTTTNQGVGSNLRIRREFRDQDEEQNVFGLSIGGEHFTGSWTIGYTGSYSQTTRDEDDFRMRFETDNNIDDVNYAFGTDNYLLQPTTPEGLVSLNNRANYEFDHYRETFEDSVDNNTEIKIDFERTFNWGYIKFGSKYFKHDKNVDVENSIYEGAFNEADDTTLAKFSEFQTDFEIGEWGPSAPVNEVINFYREQFASGNIGVRLRDGLPRQGDINDNLIDGFVDDYDSQEEIFAIYGLGNIDISDRMTLNTGIRVEQTDFISKGFAVNTGDFTGNISRELNFDKDYTDVLPSANLRWNIQDNLIFRAGVFLSVVRPSFARNNPGIAVDFDEDDNELRVDASNPNLEPFSANSYDLNLAWYPGGDGSTVLQVGLFYKDIDNFIFRANVDVDSTVGQEIITRSGDPRFGTADDIEIRTGVNGESATVKGVELSWYQQLPYSFDIKANTTVVDSNATLETRSITLIGQPDITINLSFGWANKKWDVRLTTAYTDDFLIRLNDESVKANDVYANAHTQIDFGVKYELNKHVSIYFDAINLTKQEEFAELGSNGSGFVQKYQNIERTFLLGLRGSFK